MDFVGMVAAADSAERAVVVLKPLRLLTGDLSVGAQRAD
jgi:hypothetical protein